MTEGQSSNHRLGAAERLTEFRGDLPRLTDDQIIRKHVVSGPVYVLDDAAYFALRDAVGNHFGIHSNNVYMVGSGKLGFSIKPSRRWGLFCDGSDIDLAIVSDQLFDCFWKALLRYDEAGGFWSRRSEFLSALLQGWIRPDKLPGASFEKGNDWWEFFRSLTASGQYGQYKISAGLYRELNFLEIYQSRCVKQCRRSLETAP